MTRRFRGQAAIERTPSSARPLHGQAAIARTPFSAGTLHGQAAMEYLMTYGWALLVLGIVVLLIYSSGIFSPSYLVSDQCDFDLMKFPCQFLIYSRDGNTYLELQLENGFGYPLKFNSMTATVDTYGPMQLGNLPSEKLESGDSGQISAVLENTELGKGSSAVIRVQLEYFSCAPEVNPECLTPEEESEALHLASGRIIGKVN